MNQSHLYAVILAGGRGTRFWPRSRTRRAKQVLELFGSGSLIQQTVERLSSVVPLSNCWVLTNDHLRDEIARQLPKVPKRQILAEPAQRNTAPAIGLAAHILNSVDPKAVMGVFPADHIIQRPARFVRLVKAAYRNAAKGKMVLLGIQPRWAEPGYGYLEFAPGALRPGTLEPAPIIRFREKPDPATAAAYLASGNFCWNAGMFFWRAQTLQTELRRHLPGTAGILDQLPSFSSRGFADKLRTAYPDCENISIDFAVAEKAAGIEAIVADDIGWNDAGGWNALYELLPHDGDNNASRGDAVFLGSAGNYVDAQGKLVALLGVDDLIVVDTADALLVTTRQHAHRVGELVKRLEATRRDELL